MEIGEYLRVLQRLWWAVLLTIAIGAGVGYATSLTSTREYESRAQLFVTTQSGSSVGDAYQNNLFSQQRAVSYAGLATSRQVAARAVDQLKTGISADDLRAKISAAAVENTVLLDITARDPDPAMAQVYANAVSVQLVQLVSELETSRRGGTPAAGAVIVDDASYPTNPLGLSLLHRIGFGAAGGLLAALVLVVLATFADTRMRRREGVEAATGTSMLGTLVEDPKRADVAAVDLKAGGLAAERIRELRNNLLFSRDPDGHRASIIAVTSPSRGDCRTTVAIDLAAAFAESGHSVLLVDGDFVHPALADRLELEGEHRAQAGRGGLSTVLHGEHDLSEVVIDRPGGLPFSLLPAGPVPSVSRQLWSSNAAPDTIDAMGRHFDFVVIDTPAQSDCADGALVAALGDGAILLARIGRTKNAELRTSLNALTNAHAFFLGAVATCEPGHRRQLAAERKAPKQGPSAKAPKAKDDPDRSGVEPVTRPPTKAPRKRPAPPTASAPADRTATPKSKAESTRPNPSANPNPTPNASPNPTHRVARPRPGGS